MINTHTRTFTLLVKYCYVFTKHVDSCIIHDTSDSLAILIVLISWASCAIYRFISSELP